MERSAHFTIGTLDCWAVSDAEQPGTIHVDDWALDAPPDALAAWLDERGIAADAIPLDWLCLLVKTGAGWLLVDAGSGDTAPAGSGKLRQHLAALGVSAGDIATVVISHSHFDHIGGTLLADGRPAFPNARIVLHEAEREQLALQPPVPHVLYEAAEAYLPALAKQLEYAAEGQEVLPGAKLVGIPGHTTGSTALLLRSQGERLLFGGDLFYHALQVEHPEWSSQYDLRPAQAAASRERIYQWAADEGLWVLPAHAPLPGIGRIVRAEGGYRWLPQPPNAG